MKNDSESVQVIKTKDSETIKVSGWVVNNYANA